jgi:ribosomal protein L15E
MSVTSKNRRKALQSVIAKRKQFDIENDDFFYVNEDGLKKRFPNVKDRMNYINALVEEFSK